MTIEIRPITPNVGADIYGANLSSQSDLDDIKQAFVDHSVIAIRGLDMSPEQHIAFAESWGDINVNRFFKPVDGHPKIATVLEGS